MMLPTRPLTIRETVFFWEKIKPLLAGHPDLARAVAEQAEVLHREGLPNYTVAARIAANIIQMEAEGISPFGSEMEISRRLRIVGNRIATDTWEPEPDVDHLAVNAAASPGSIFDPWARHEALHSQAVSVIEPDGRIVDSRQDRSLDHAPCRPSAVVQGGLAWEMGD